MSMVELTGPGSEINLGLILFSQPWPKVTWAISPYVVTSFSSFSCWVEPIDCGLGRYLLLSLIEVSGLELQNSKGIWANIFFPELPFHPPTSGPLAGSLAVIEVSCRGWAVIPIAEW